MALHHLVHFDLSTFIHSERRSHIQQNANVSLACAAVDERLCLHGNGADDLELLCQASDLGY